MLLLWQCWIWCKAILIYFTLSTFGTTLWCAKKMPSTLLSLQSKARVTGCDWILGLPFSMSSLAWPKSSIMRAGIKLSLCWHLAPYLCQENAFYAQCTLLSLQGPWLAGWVGKLKIEPNPENNWETSVIIPLLITVLFQIKMLVTYVK